MATAVSLPAAAGQSFDDLYPIWVAGGDTFRTAVATFASSLLPTFPDSDTVGRPIADWLAVLATVASSMPSVVAPATTDFSLYFVPVQDHVYRVCWLGAKAMPTSPQITNAQQAALLAAYNANF